MKKHLKVVSLCIIALLVLIGAKPLMALAEPTASQVVETSQEPVIDEPELSESIPSSEEIPQESSTPSESETPTPSLEQAEPEEEDILDLEELDESEYDEVYEDDVEITAATTISNKKVLYKGNVYVRENLNISGASYVNIVGELFIESNIVKLANTSDLKIEGNLQIAKRNNDETEGGLDVTNTATVTVKGDLISNTSYYTSRTLFTGTSSATANSATLYLYGDLRVAEGSKFVATNYTSSTVGSHIVFAGDGEQHISMPSDAVLGRVRNENLTPLCVDTVINNAIFTEDTTLKGTYIEITKWTLASGKTLTFDGNWVSKEAKSVGGKFHVKGDLIVEANSLALTGSSNLVIDGNLRMETRTGGLSTGGLDVTNTTTVTVKGDLISNTSYYTSRTLFTGTSSATANSATLYLYGDLRVAEGSKFVATNYTSSTVGSHIVFAGEGEQHISMPSDAVLGRVRNENLTPLCVDTVINNAIFTEDTTLKGTYIEITKWTLASGKTLTFDGNWVSKEAKSVGGKFHVKGDLIVEANSLALTGSSNLVIDGNLRMETRTGGLSTGGLDVTNTTTVTVKGDLISNTSYYTSRTLFTGTSSATANSATLYLYGDLRVAEGSKFVATNYTSSTVGSHIVFAGEGEQHISMPSDAVLGRVRNENSAFLCVDTVINNAIFTEDTTLKGTYIEITKWTLASGKTLTFDGNWVSKEAKSVGGKFHVKGDLIVEANSLALTGSSNLVIDGNLRMETRTGGLSTGGLEITNTTTVTVKGDLISNTSYYTGTSYTGKILFTGTSSATANSATLYLYGDLRVAEGSKFVATNYTSSTVGSHIVFAGEGEQHISMPSDAVLGRVRNENSTFLYVDDTISHAIFLNNTVLNGTYLSIINHVVNDGVEITVNGNLVITENLTINKPHYVNGDVIVESGILSITSGKFEVSGNLRIQKYYNSGFIQTDAALKILGSSIVDVKGDFICNTTYYTGTSATYSLYGNSSSKGIMKIGGSLDVLGGYFNASYGNSPRMIFTSDSASIDAEGQSLGRIESIAPSKRISLRSSVEQLTAGSNLTFIPSFYANVKVNNLNANGYNLIFEPIMSPIIFGTVNLNGGTITSTGHTIVNGNGSLNIGSGYFYTTGGLTINDSATITISSNSGILIVDGDFTFSSSKSTTISNGTLQLNGDVRITETVDFKTGTNAMAYLLGKGSQILSFPYTNSKTFLYFATLTINKDISNYTFSKEPCWGTLINGELTALNCWYNSESPEVGYWRQMPNVYYESYSENDKSYYSMIGLGLNQWSTALNVTSGYQTFDKSSANIEVYTGNQSDLVLEGVIKEDQIKEKQLAFTDVATVETSHHTYNGIIVKVRRVSEGKIVFYDDKISDAATDNSFNVNSYYQHCMTHELGHVLGWFGHSPNSADLMYGHGSANNTITFRDRDHLKQIYDMYR